MKRLFILLSILILTAAGANYATAAGNTDAMLQYNQGIDFYKVGQYDKAVNAFRASIKLDPNYIDAYYNLGSVLEYLGQYDAALAVFKQVIVRKPEDYESVYKAAWLSHQMGQDSRAKSYLSIIPNNCPRAQDVQELMSQLNINAVSEPPEETYSSQANQSSDIYENITSPTGIASDRDGNVYVAEFTNNSILKITPDNKKIVFIKDPKISGPIGLVCDSIGNIYIANYNKDNVLKVSNSGQISVLISNVKKPYCLYQQGKMLFISCQGTSSVLRYRLKD